MSVENCPRKPPLAENFESNDFDYESLSTQATFLQQILAGTLAGVTEHSISYPCDNLKTRFQCMIRRGRSLSLKELYSSTVQQEGFLGLYKGVSAMIMGAAPAHALYFGVYETFNRVKENNPNTNTNFYNAAAGVLATLGHDSIMFPTEAIKQRFQLQDCPFKNVRSCATCVIKDEGFRALYKSLRVQLITNIPYHSTNFIVYEWGNKVLNPDKEYSPASHLVSGAMAGSAGAIITSPLDVCKTLLNTQKISGKSVKVDGIISAIGTILRTHGIRGFFNGGLLRIMTAAPGTTACWSVYELFKHVLVQNQN